MRDHAQLYDIENALYVAADFVLLVIICMTIKKKRSKGARRSQFILTYLLLATCMVYLPVGPILIFAPNYPCMTGVIITEFRCSVCLTLTTLAQVGTLSGFCLVARSLSEAQTHLFKTSRFFTDHIFTRNPGHVGIPRLDSQF